MILVDTSAWIKWLIDSDLAPVIAEHMPEQDACLVPTIVQMELAKRCARNGDPGFARRMIGFTSPCEVATLDTATALHAARLCADHSLSTADAIIYATTLAYGADLLTCDRHFQDLPSVRYVPKLRH